MDSLAALLERWYGPEWEASGRTAAHTMDRLLKTESEENLRAAAADIRALLGRDLCEHQVSATVLYELGSRYDPRSEGVDVSEWLRRLERRIRHPGSTSQPDSEARF